MPKIHMRDLRLQCNAGMEFPVCYVNVELLGIGKGRLPTSGNWKDVTCKRCRPAWERRYGDGSFD